jgi:transglutaminase-like putative cysteine protease
VRYSIHHETIYTYNQPVILAPHCLRLRPRSDGWQTVERFRLKVTPKPLGMGQAIELDGNTGIQVWFAEEIEILVIETESTIETHVSNPFSYLLEPWATRLPFDYPISLQMQLQPYLQPYGPVGDPAVSELARDLLHETDNQPNSFLFALNSRIYNDCEYIIRPDGEPWTPGITWTKRQGSCRDFVVLFMDVCRAVGLATRFVSGYQEGDPDGGERDLHAWVEVYLPGGGWRGYDPTHGLAVSDRHIALVSSPIPGYCAPVVGTAKPVRKTDLALASRREARRAIDIR